MRILTPAEVFEPDLKAGNWTSTAVSFALLALHATRIAECVAVGIQLWDLKSDAKTSTGVTVLIKLHISNNREPLCI